MPAALKYFRRACGPEQDRRGCVGMVEQALERLETDDIALLDDERKRGDGLEPAGRALLGFAFDRVIINADASDEHQAIRAPQ